MSYSYSTILIITLMITTLVLSCDGCDLFNFKYRQQQIEFYQSNFTIGMSSDEVIKSFGLPENVFQQGEEKIISGWDYRSVNHPNGFDYKIKSFVYLYLIRLNLREVAVLIYFDENEKTEFIVFGET